MDVPKKVEVLVIGSGPAGSTAAEHCALGGAETLVIDRRPVVGVPIRCGELMPENEEIHSIFPDVMEISSLFGFPSSLRSVSCEVMRIYSPSMRTYDVPFRSWTTYRDRFDQYLAAKAQKAGARVLTGVRCLDLKGHRVSTDHGIIEAEVIIGADGPLSVVAKALRLERPKDLCPAISTVAKGRFEPIPKMYFGSIAPGGYAWIIPKDEGANVGLGYSRLFTDRKLHDFWVPFKNMLGRETGHLNGKLVPMSGPIDRTVVGDSLVVGDAAGQVMPVNGGGIPIAMICGRIAGQAAANRIRKGADLAEYDMEWRIQVGAQLDVAVRTKRLAMMAFGSPWRLETAMRMLRVKRMGRAIRCKSLFP
ncbi:MAG: NAD(P)/FAD-dependent oxidoreductase [Methanomassiliicoccales archaeon]|nr:NAD(P)/FAD-dependent oxidoreductase [Methanomassiliicoccales archaeon]